MPKSIRTSLSSLISRTIRITASAGRTLLRKAIERQRAFLFVLTGKERFAFTAFAALFCISVFALAGRGYYGNTRIVPAVGGTYTEGLTGQPHLVNPLFAASNDADRDIAMLVFAGLMRYTPSGGLAPDMAEHYEMSEDGKVYTFTLRSDITWHDGAKLTSDDVLFTIQLVQDQRVESPVRPNWQGVKAERLDDLRIRFTLENPYAPFLENTTLGILPKHRWEKIPTENLRLAELNLEPIGSGPFRFDRFGKDRLGAITSYTLVRNAQAKPNAPYIQRFVFRFFPSEEEMVRAFHKDDIDGIGLLTSRSAAALRDSRTGDAAVHAVNLPRYFAVFFNQSSSRVLAEKPVRSALRAALDEPEIENRLTDGRGVPLDGPIPAGLEGFSQEPPATSSPEQSSGIVKAREILREGGWKDADGDGILERVLGKDKTPSPLAFTLTTSDFADLKEDAEILREAWSALGAKVELRFLQLAELERDALRPRAYEALLFGEVLSLEPDPFAFWHSSQKQDPGLNLALYESRAADRLLEEARLTLQKDARVRKLQEFARLVREDIPAIFLYTPHFLYGQRTRVSGFNMDIIALPAQRFADVHNWHIKTDRIWNDEIEN